MSAEHVDNLLRAFGAAEIETPSGPRPLGWLPAFFSTAPLDVPDGFESVEVVAGGLPSAGVLWNHAPAEGAAGRVLLPKRASSWVRVWRGEPLGISERDLRRLQHGLRELSSARHGLEWWIGGRPRSLFRPLVMGVLNTTPDSFSDGGLYESMERALGHGLAMAEAGADIIDVGGESTRPGSAMVEVDEEIARVVPVIRALRAASSVTLSVDTRKAAVASAALDAGADIINDVSGLRFDPQMVELVASRDCGVVVMHLRDDPAIMQQHTHYEDILAEVADHLERSVKLAYDWGIDLRRVIVDPGIGFGKDLGHNLDLIAGMRSLWSLGRPSLLGPSRKRFIGELTGRGPSERGAGTLAAVSAGVLEGAGVVRVHDVAEALDAVKLCMMLRDRF